VRPRLPALHYLAERKSTSKLTNKRAIAEITNESFKCNSSVAVDGANLS
jgi:hypothetical protein